jgi:protein phosphatase
MRVLGDVDAAPEIDTMVFDTRPGDRWLICSDGLSSYVAESALAAVLAHFPIVSDAADHLVKEALDHGAPDNVTVVLVDIDESGDSSSVPPVTVGSAAFPLSFEGDTGRKVPRLPTLLLHPLKATKPDDSHFEPESDDFLSELIEEDARRARRRRVFWLAFVIVVLLAIVAGLVGAYQWTQTRYYVGSDAGTVAIYQGVQQNLGPVELHHVRVASSIPLTSLSSYQRGQIEATISVGSLAEAEKILSSLGPTP